MENKVPLSEIDKKILNSALKESKVNTTECSMPFEVITTELLNGDLIGILRSGEHVVLIKADIPDKNNNIIPKEEIENCSCGKKHLPYKDNNLNHIPIPNWNLSSEEISRYF